MARYTETAALRRNAMLAVRMRSHCMSILRDAPTDLG